MKRRYLTIFFLFLIKISSFGQTDSIQILDFETYMSIVREFHPVARLAEINREIGDAYVLKSRGGFDPKIQGDIDQKYFDGSKYYSLINTSLKVPTWFGLSFESGYERMEGTRLNPQNYTPDAGLWYAGVSVPLGKGLFIDQRRADLQQAKIYQQSSEIVQKAMINELLYESIAIYFDWFKSYNKLILYDSILKTAQLRLEGIVSSVQFGDRPSIDTLEASVQVQSRQFKYNEALLEFQNDTELLSVYLWNDAYVPMEVNEKSVPFDYKKVSISPFDNQYLAAIDTMHLYHPDILIARYKVDFQKVENRLNKENLKPQLDLKYNAINQPINGNPITEYSINNYKWGAQVSMPLFLRKERGELRISQLVVEEQERNLDFKTEMIQYKAQMAKNNWINSYQQAILYSRTANDYRTLLDAEQTLLTIGESSLFLVNSRELTFIDAQLNLLDVLTKNLKAQYEMEFALGLLR